MQGMLILSSLIFAGDRMVMEKVLERHPGLAGIRIETNVDGFRLGSANIPPHTDFYLRVKALGISRAFPDMDFLRRVFRMSIPVHYRVIFAEEYIKNYYRQRIIAPKIMAHTETEWVKTIGDGVKKVINIELRFVEPPTRR